MSEQKLQLTLLGTLESLIDVASLINVALGILFRINKRSPWNKRSLGKNFEKLINVAPSLMNGDSFEFFNVPDKFSLPG